MVGPELGGSSPDRLFGVLALGVNKPSLSAPLSLCQSHMVGAFSQNNVTLADLPMILPSESDMTYQCVVCFIMYS